VLLDPSGIDIAFHDSSDQVHPSVAWDGAHFLVVWQDAVNGNPDIYSARVDASGNVLDPGDQGDFAASVAISTAPGAQTAPRVAWNGSAYLVVWQDMRNGSSDVYGARVNAFATVLEPAGIPIATTASAEMRPAVASNGSSYFVAWDGGISNDVSGAVVNAAGAVLPGAGTPISIAAGQQSSPAIAWSGSRYLVVWEDGRAANFDIYGTRVTTTNGAIVVQDPAGLPISGSQPNNQQAPAVTFNGDFLVLWQDERNNNDDIFATRVSDGGTVKDGGFSVASATTAGGVAAAPGPSNKWALVYQRADGAKQHVFLRTVSPK
jgi:hypothetical protein